MKARVEISNYIEGRFNSTKLEKLQACLQEKFDSFISRPNQEYPEEGVLVYVGMSAKYQTPYVKCEEWGNYKSVAEFETLIQDALEERGFEFADTEWDDGDGEGWLKIEFE